jgi:uncharacterized protein YdaU (DUF1376 family)
MNYYPFHVGDYLRDTVHLEPMEDLAYRRLLDLYYLTESPIPLETQSVSRRLRLGFDVVEMVLNEFFNRTDDGYMHKRCDAEIASFQRRSERARVNGKAGGRPKNQRIKPSGFPVGSQQEPSGNPVATQWKANHNHNHITSVGFKSFWEAYPKKVGKGFAAKAWEKHKPDLDQVLNALAWQTVQPNWTKNGGQYVPNPATYINQQRWQDEPQQGQNTLTTLVKSSCL